MNKLDSELVAGALAGAGFALTDDAAGADVILFNTCSVRQHAEDKVYSRLGQLRRRKAVEPGLVLGIIGCMAENVREDLFTRLPHLDLICGPGELHRVPELVEGALTAGTQGVALAPKKRGGKPFVDPDSDPLERLDLGRLAGGGRRDDPWRAYLRVQRGCNHMCAFCIVPYTRGKEVYRPPANILQEVQGLVDDGVVELTLLGQNINSYRWVDEAGKVWGLGDLIRMLDGVAGLRRLRFVTSHPADMDDDILRAVGQCPKAAAYLHMPAQSGSNAVLAAMRRGYTREFYIQRAARARELIADVAIASDFIVGFPGETDEDFAATESLVREVGFKSSFIFKYSPRSGTPAARGSDDVPDAVKRDRNQRLLAVQEEVSLAHNRGWVGRAVEVLCEGPSRQGQARQTEGGQAAAAASREGLSPSGGLPRRLSLPLAGRLANRLASDSDRMASQGCGEAQGSASGACDDLQTMTPGHTESTKPQLMGRTAGDHIAVFDGDPSLAGQFVTVLITDVTAHTLKARLVR